MSDDLAFSGLKVLDFSQGVAGPHCGMLLAQNESNTAFSTSESHEANARPALEICWSSGS